MVQAFGDRTSETGALSFSGTTSSRVLKSHDVIASIRMQRAHAAEVLPNATVHASMTAKSRREEFVNAKTILILGATSTMGLEACSVFLEKGWKVQLAARNLNVLAEGLAGKSLTGSASISMFPIRCPFSPKSSSPLSDSSGAMAHPMRTTPRPFCGRISRARL
jgi:hypothetical protein